jgi:hypothetical protein
MTFSCFSAQTTDMELESVRLDLLQQAVRTNEVSFPSQVPVFVRHAPPDLQCRVVQLYFIHGWSCGKIAKRYGFVRNYIWGVVNEWRRHAVSLGYIQVIPPMPQPFALLTDAMPASQIPAAVFAGTPAGAYDRVSAA